MRSDKVTKGVERAPMRSLFYAMGYTKEELEMYEQDTPAYYGTFDFEDTVIGRDYRALVGVYAERNGGGDLRSVYTNEVTAKR
mgnify:CR=1 FL=1